MGVGAGVGDFVCVCGCVCVFLSVLKEDTCEEGMSLNLFVSHVSCFSLYLFTHSITFPPSLSLFL